MFKRSTSRPIARQCLVFEDHEASWLSAASIGDSLAVDYKLQTRGFGWESPTSPRVYSYSLRTTKALSSNLVPSFSSLTTIGTYHQTQSTNLDLFLPRCRELKPGRAGQGTTVGGASRRSISYINPQLDRRGRRVPRKLTQSSTQYNSGENVSLRTGPRYGQVSASYLNADGDQDGFH